MGVKVNKSIVFFDGVCNLCNGFIDFMIRKDKGRKFIYGALQDSKSRELLVDFPTADMEEMSTVLLLHQGKLYKKSNAVRKIFLLLGGFWKFIGLIMSVVPAFIADKIYDIIARRRYRILGKRNTCRIPTEEEASLFL